MIKVDGSLFDLCFERVIGEEGGFVNNPADPGGATKYGITIKTLRNHAKLLGLEKVDIETVRNLTLEQAKAIYRATYWPPVVDVIKNIYWMSAPSFRWLAMALFDACVNMGPGTMRRLWERTKVREQFALARCEYYAKLAVRRPALRQFLAGWILRACRYGGLVLEEREA